MIIVKPSCSLLWITEKPLQQIERAARVCYKSENKITKDSYKDMIKMLVQKNHLAMLEHASLSVLVVCDRGVSHEIVRHRLFSFAQESTRYCSYNLDKFSNNLHLVEPPNLSKEQHDIWMDAMLSAEKSYMELVKQLPAQIARSVLPTCLKTEIVITGNFREWIHFFKLRTAPSAHPRIIEISNLIIEEVNLKTDIDFAQFLNN